MRERIERLLPEHTFVGSKAGAFYIVDYADDRDGDVCLLEEEPADINYVSLNNEEQQIHVLFDGFKKNALPLKKGEYSKQCECVIFPEACSHSDWILFIETKYTANLKSAFNEKNNYPQYMIEQILATVNYFREKGILDADKVVRAIVSFPNLMESFSETFFDSIDDTPVNFLRSHNVMIRATNSATIKSAEKILLH